MRHARLFLTFTLFTAAAFSQAAARPSAKLTAEQRTAKYFDSIKNDPVRLRMFLQAMPKGGDLHNHITGAVYAESYIQWAVESDLCVDLKDKAIDDCKPGPDGAANPEQRPARAAYTDPSLYRELIDVMSMRNHAITFPHKPGHDHFFDTFLKFNRLVNERRGESLAELSRRAAAQNILYLELTSTWDLGVPLSVAEKVEKERAARRYIREPDLDLEDLRQQLLDAGLGAASKSAFLDHAEARKKEILKCGTPGADPGCNVVVRYEAEALRAFTPVQVFSMLVWAFEQNNADPRFVAINMVQPEDWYVPVHDYDLHMKMIDFLHKKYPKVNITLHAGELTLGLVPPEVLGTHVAKAIDQGHARRIGHGTDILYDPKARERMRAMAQKGIAVEISLSSSEGILGITGARHPLRQYLNAGVPVIICTDDEGVSRSDLTNEYLKAVLDQGLSYADLKRSSRNGVDFSFLAADDKQKVKTRLEQALREFESAY
ncbi:MAG: adenosine deaminase [Acidobacteriales bacterium]|nr:adenosine deaminase [Terriglobales bacterium]